MGSLNHMRSASGSPIRSNSGQYNRPLTTILDNIYLGTGNGPTADNTQYDIIQEKDWYKWDVNTDVLTAKSDYLTGLGYYQYAAKSCSVKYNNKIYCFGSSLRNKRNRLISPPASDSTFLNRIVSYDIRTDVWALLAPFPDSSIFLCPWYTDFTCLYRGKIYFIDTTYFNNPPAGVQYSHKCYYYDIQTDTWGTLPDFPTSTPYSKPFGYNGKIYNVGYPGSTWYSLDIEDEDANWQVAKLLIGR